MVSHLLVVAFGFRLTGLLLGIAAVAALVDLADTALMLHRLPPPEPGAPLDVGSYGLVGLLTNVARGTGKLGYAFLTGPGAWFVKLLIVAALMMLLLALLLYFTGRGVGHHAPWARIVAMAMSIGLAIVSCGIAAVMERNVAPLTAVPIALSLYTLWVLIWRFA